MTRLAPSPTGALHLGNARTFLANWAMARKCGWGVLLRVEDIDHPRVRPGAIDQTREELAWLGLDWDEEAPLQSTDLEPCLEALRTLAAKGLIYPCDRTRAELAPSAPNEGDGSVCAHASLRPPGAGTPCNAPTMSRTWRLLVDSGAEPIVDAFSGPSEVDVASDCGDFAIWTRSGVPAYQLAVTVDDARQGVTQVVRGDDLLPSAARQQLLQRHLGLPTPTWWHLPLLRGPDGRRLAKRHGDSRLARWREGSPERVIGLLAMFSGLTDDLCPMDAATFASSFSIDHLPAHDIIVTPAHLAWLDA